jgi:hypothetical protein
MKRSTLPFLVLAAALVAALVSPRLLHRLPPGSGQAGVPGSASVPAVGSQAAAPTRPEVAFRSPERLAEHWRKHGREFGDVTMDEYLRLAQTLRDRPAWRVPPSGLAAGAAGGVLEAVRRDGVVTRFDRASGAFLAFEADGTIRTFFKPHDGEAYFRRQLERSHEGP